MKRLPITTTKPLKNFYILGCILTLGTLSWICFYHMYVDNSMLYFQLPYTLDAVLLHNLIPKFSSAFSTLGLGYSQSWFRTKLQSVDQAFVDKNPFSSLDDAYVII